MLPRLMNIYLLGYMGCGKTRTGQALAACSGRSFLDLDTLFEERMQTRIPDFFNRFGEAVFREKESELMKETAQYSRCIVALGGGTPCFADNMTWIRNHGYSVYLQMDAGRLAQRLQQPEERQRPLLSGIKPEELYTHIRNHLKEREAYYLQADCTWPGGQVSATALWEHLSLPVAAREKTE